MCQQALRLLLILQAVMLLCASLQAVELPSQQSTRATMAMERAAWNAAACRTQIPSLLVQSGALQVAGSYLLCLFPSLMVTGSPNKAAAFLSVSGGVTLLLGMYAFLRGLSSEGLLSLPLRSYYTKAAMWRSLSNCLWPWGVTLDASFKTASAWQMQWCTADASIRDPSLVPVDAYQFTSLLRKVTRGQRWIVRKKNIHKEGRVRFNKNLFHVQRIVPKNNCPTTVIFFGDIHGDIAALTQCIGRLKDDMGVIDETFKIVKPNTYIIFGGDYVDNGAYGIETLLTILKLKRSNPRTVFLIRGNHEDTEFGNEQESRLGAAKSFHRQVRMLYGKAKGTSLLRAIQRLYVSMPVALFFEGPGGAAQFLHGGTEPGYDSSLLLRKKLPADSQDIVCEILNHQCIKRTKRFDPFCNDPGVARILSNGEEYTKNGIDTLINDPQRQLTHTTIGFSWNCFKEKMVFSDEYNSLGISESYHRWYHIQWAGNGITKIFRAHQHGHPTGDAVSDALRLASVSVLPWDPPIITHVTTSLDGHTAQSSFVMWSFGGRHHPESVEHHLYDSDNQQWSKRVLDLRKRE